MMRLILLGDSIRKGYQPAVAKLLAGGAEVWGPEDNGRTSRYTREHLPGWVEARLAEGGVQRVVVHINCGLHDLARDAETAWQPRVTLEEYKNNLDWIFSWLNERLTPGRDRLIWASTTPTNESNHRRIKGFERYEADVENYNIVASVVASDHKVAINDLHAAVMTAGRDELLLEDGVHFGDAGSMVLAKQVIAAVGV